jgi:hypothetical protein
LTTDFEIFIDDDRYSVPSLYLISVVDHERARLHAERLLYESAHHRGVEVRHGGVRVYGAGSFAAARAHDVVQASDDSQAA